MSNLIKQLRDVVGRNHILTTDVSKKSFSKGFRFGAGEVLAVVKPETLLEVWELLQICVKNDVIVITQAANTGLTGGSTPDGKDYDRPVIIINTMRIDDIQIIDEGKQIVGLAGSTLFDLENKLNEFKVNFFALTEAYRSINHINQVELPKFPNQLGEVDNSQIRVDYLLGKINEKKWKSKLKAKMKKMVRKT